MKITTDTNLLVRLFVKDDEAQSDIARRTLEAAETVVVPTVALCELIWVLRAVYGQSRQVALQAVESIVRMNAVVVDDPVVEAGLQLMRAGGDFADAAIATEGLALGGEAFVSFDRAAVRRLSRLGVASRDAADAG